MNTKLFLIFIVEFAFCMNSCKSNPDEVPEEPRWGAFTPSDYDRIDYLVSLIPDSVTAEFNLKYNTWIVEGGKISGGHSFNLYFYYTLPEEWNILLEYCLQYDLAIYPLVFKKVNYHPTIHLLQGLAGGDPYLFVPYHNLKVGGVGDMSIIMSYSKDFLDKEDENILKSIQDTFGIDNEA